jgi:hypothetical protein
LLNLRHHPDVFLKKLTNTNDGDGGIWGKVDKDRKIKNALSLTGTGLKT